MSENLDQTALDALLQASPEQLQEALGLKTQEQPTEEQAQVLQTSGVATGQLGETPAAPAVAEPEDGSDGQSAAPAGQQQNENPQRVINGVSAQTRAEIPLAVALQNSLSAMESWLMMFPDGQAKHGMRAEIVSMREMLS